ncbi:response regulator transcription factor [Hydrogenivirga sp. 128-5-R1-1]|uniref:response regulator transcription factor n=1 Tax=Hydrogenivirga sp. 128-5-R1-1 TaxID=392423 RepID=UPI00015F1817|nr:response regulator transcription factor [Hydrogenivirga sp. 128-5-R1-1]EDP76028.1 transcriptional regulator (PhoB-like) protein [Hydrogenivirga sp. 128-5-R1-1]
MLVYILEDDEDIALVVEAALKREGFEVKSFQRALEFFPALEEKTPDLVIVDVMLPDLDGFRVARVMKNRPDLEDVPIVFLTARATEVDRLKGFHLGADDYITKPFSIRELTARVRAVLRRVKRGREGRVFRVGSLEVDVERVKVSIGGSEVKLTPSEFNILRCLLENYGRPVNRSRIIEEVWGHDHEATDRTVDVHIKHLRDKLGAYGKCIKTVRGFGYKFEA